MYLLIIALNSWSGGDRLESNTFSTQQLCKDAQLKILQQRSDVKIVADCLYTGKK